MLNEKLYEYIQDSENPETNFNLAVEYKNIGQTAASISFFLRCADRSGDDLDLAYECLIHIGQCFDMQGNRLTHAYGAYKQAIAILPKRPEAYYYLCRLKNWNSSYDDGYNYSNIALSVCDFDNLKPLRSIEKYSGKHCLLFELAMSSWHWGKIEECKNVFLDLYEKDWEKLDEYQKHISEKYLNEYYNISIKSLSRTDIINSLVKKINAKKYLEIGVEGGINLSAIECDYKIGVDPNTSSLATLHVTSDEFFETNTEKFDVIFVDGLHHSDQVLKDILNSLDVLNDGGYIVCHDMNPIKEEHQFREPRELLWNGDCWKAFVQLRKERSDLEMFVIDTDHGCGVIRRGNQVPIKINEEINYENFDKNRKEWMNLISVDEFLEKLNHITNILENKNSIPVIGVPIVNGVHWLRRLLDSVDYPVKNFFIINNNGKGEITQELNEICSQNYPFIENIHVAHMPSNLGVSGSWNLIIKSYMMESYWMIVNHDIMFSPGMLEKMYLEAENNHDAGMIHARKSPEHDCGTYDLFLIKDWVIQKCGLFDENCYPAYCEDLDYYIRCKNENISYKVLDIDYLHGDKDYATSGSQTWRLNPSLKEKLDKSRIFNNEYLLDKWGENYLEYKTISRPFNNSSYDTKHTTYDLSFVREKNAGF